MRLRMGSVALLHWLSDAVACVRNALDLACALRCWWSWTGAPGSLLITAGAACVNGVCFGAESRAILHGVLVPCPSFAWRPAVRSLRPARYGSGRV